MIKKQLTYLLLLFTAFIFVSCEKEVFTGLAPEKPAVNSKLFIRSNPSGSLIYYNNKYMGLKTPDTLTWLTPGAQTILLKRELFFDEVINATVTGNNTTEVFLDYTQNPKQYGDFSCLSFSISYTIYINGVNTGYTTPHTFTHMFPGIYLIKYVKKDYRSDSTSLTLEAGATRNTNFTLQDTSKWVDYSTKNSKLLTDDCYSIICDKKNVKWIGSSRGINSFDGKNWKSYDITNSVVQGPIVRLAEDNSSNIWAASSNGLFMFNGTAWIDYTAKLASKNVTGVTCDASGVIWISTNSGIAKFDGATWTLYRAGNSGLLDDNVTCIASAPNGKIWFGTVQGIGTFTGTTWASYTLANMGLDSSIGTNIKDIAVDASGFIWVIHAQYIGARGGYTKFDGTRWSEIKFTLVSTSEIISTYIDSNNRKWLSTTNGLGLFTQPSDIKKFFRLDTSIPCTNIYGSCMDKNGDVWFVTVGSGMAKIKKGNY